MSDDVDELGFTAPANDLEAEQRLSEKYARKCGELQARLDQALAFKTFVHKRLDQGGVPADPYPDETDKTGCRIGSRLKWLLTEYQP